MYSKKTNLLLGFHGCDESVRDDLLTGNITIKKSEKSYDWLGNGMYFWEGDEKRAWEWAEEKRRRKEIEKPAVIGAVMDLGLCLDFMESKYLATLKPAFYDLKALLNKHNLVLPENKKIKGSVDFLLRPLDCAIIEFIHKTRDIEEVPAFDSVRGVFWEGKEPYLNAGFKEKNHIQICVRNPNCIKGYFLPRNTDTDWPKP